MFLGEYQPNITEGSRVALPKKLREQITSKDVVLIKGFEKCLFIYDKKDWLSESQKHLEKPITDAEARNLKRYLYASASESSIDEQGRIVISQNLKDYAHLNKKIIIIGAGDHIEIWDLENWNNFIEKINQEICKQ